MTKMTRLVLAFVLIELTAVAACVPLMRWGAIANNLSSGVGVRRLETVRLLMTIVAPLTLLAARWAASRRISSVSPTLSSTQRGYGEAGILTAAFFLIAYQGWFASHLGSARVEIDRDLMVRAGAIFAGMVMAVQGNFSSKTPAPTGLRAPDPDSWRKVKARSGWTMAVAGVAIAVGAIAFPTEILFGWFCLVGLATFCYVTLQHLSVRPAHQG
jgi:hypothetical protein